jgi:flagellar assembly protein FliH
MSLSDPAKNERFQRTGWPSVEAERKPATPMGGSSGGGFQSLSQSQKPKKAASQEFASPYVSEKKLRELNEAVRKAQGPPQPDIEEIKHHAYQEGFAKGEAEGIKAGRQRAQTHVEQMERILSELSRAWEQIIATHEKQIIGLVCKVAEMVVCGQVAIDEEVVKRSILNAFSAIPEPVDVSIEVNPTDYEFIETIKEDFFECIASLRDVSVAADPSVARGGCRIHTRSGQVDGTLQARLEAVQKALMETNGHKNGMSAP